MKSHAFLVLVIAAGFSGGAIAQCTANQVLSTGTTETAQVRFSGLALGQSVTAGGLTLTATACTPNANAVATYFSSLANGASPAAPAGCSKSGSLNGWSTGANSGANLTFTSVTPSANVTDITVVGTFGAVSITQGSLSLSTLLTGSLVCGRPTAGYPGGASSLDRWQEQHRADLKLFDYKLGLGHPIDPEKQVGTYAFTGTGTASAVTHTYTYGSTSTPFTWQVYLYAAPNTYSFCAAGVEQVRAFVIAGAGVSGSGCSSTYP